MEIKPIKTDAEHQVALLEIEELWDAAVGTARGQRLDMLVALIEEYEEQCWPIHDLGFNPT